MALINALHDWEPRPLRPRLDARRDAEEVKNMAYRVECVTIDESSDYDDCRCIESIGIPTESGGTNTYSPAQIHDRIEQDGDTFFVEENGEWTFLDAVEREGTKYVRTEPNDTEDDNLLQQPSC